MATRKPRESADRGAKAATGASVPKVFISSTLEDLKDYRFAARDAVLRKGWAPLMCDYWAAGGNPPLAECMARVAPADLVVVIVAHRHGWTPADAPGDGVKSITRLECEAAKARGVEVIPFLVDDRATWDGKLYDAHELTVAAPDKMVEVVTALPGKLAALKAFKGWLNGIGVRGLFSDPVRFSGQVYEALTEWGDRRRLPPVAPSPEAIEAGYLAWLREDCQRIVLFGLDLKESQNLRLAQVYVPAVTTAKADGKPGRQPNPRESQPDLLLHRLGAESLYVPGAPGSGKSTFCRWAALCVAANDMPGGATGASDDDPFVETLPDALQGRLPILCALRQWSSHPEYLHGNGEWTCAQLEASLASWIDKVQPGGLTSAVFLEALENGRCLLILDGVDEVPEALGADYPRGNLLSGLAQALPHWQRSGNRVLLTSRPYGIEDAARRQLGLAQADILGLPEALQTRFVQRWYAAADPLNAITKASGLIDHLAGRENLEALRRNPMLLTALCVKYDEGQRLPGDLYRLYDAVVTQVLYKRYPTEIERERVRGRLAAVALAMHRGPESAPRTTPAAEAGIDEIDRALEAFEKQDVAVEGGAETIVARREDLLSNSGLLLPRDGGRAAFYHLSFQEFLAAVRLRRLGEAAAESLARHADMPEWRPTLTFVFCAIAESESPDAAFRAFAPAAQALDPARLPKAVQPALLFAECLEVAHARQWNVASFRAGMQAACKAALERLEPPPRASLWRTLGVLGLDDRPGVGVRGGLPDIEWVEIPASRFIYQEGKRKIPHGAFWIARYPVTNAQFRCFVEAADGYANEAWWEGLERGTEPKRPMWAYANHPRETVSWYEATAFCRWLDARMARAKRAWPKGWKIRLPSEQEWERAARGEDGNEYPWGNGYRSGCANVDETERKEGPHYIQSTTAVGIYPSGDAGCGVNDLSGNVWEWCQEVYDPKSKKEYERTARVLRGGSCDLRSGLRARRLPLQVSPRPPVRLCRLSVVLRSPHRLKRCSLNR